MSFALQSLSALRRLGIVVLLAIAFLFGLATTVYLSLRSPEVTVPEVVGKDRYEAEKILAQADLNFRVRATRPSNQVKADTVLFQLPRAGEVVKVGQTVAMDISRTTLAGEASEADATDKKLEEEKRRFSFKVGIDDCVLCAAIWSDTEFLQPRVSEMPDSVKSKGSSDGGSTGKSSIFEVCTGLS